MSDDIETIVIDIIKPNSKPFVVRVSNRPPEIDRICILIIWLVFLIHLKMAKRNIFISRFKLRSAFQKMSSTYNVFKLIF
jgi:hypothetical protein